MQPLIVRMSVKWPILALIAVPACVGALHVLAILGRSTLGPIMDRLVHVADIFGGLLFVGGLVGIVVGLWRKPRLVLDETGFWASGLGGLAIPWSEMDDVLLVSTMGRQTGDMLCLKLTNPAPYIERLKGLARIAQAANRRKGLEHLSVPVMMLDASPARIHATALAYLEAAHRQASSVTEASASTRNPAPSMR